MGKSEEEAPKTYSSNITEHASRKIDYITGYIAYIRHEPLNAIRVGDEIFRTIDRIKKNPFVFRECDAIPTRNKIYRKAVCLSWLIIYKIESHNIVVLGIIHGHRGPSRIRSIRKAK